MVNELSIFLNLVVTVTRIKMIWRNVAKFVMAYLKRYGSTRNQTLFYLYKFINDFFLGGGLLIFLPLGVLLIRLVPLIHMV